VSVRSQKNLGTNETTPDQAHPAWCDRTRCTADPASQANGYRPSIGGQHRSAPLRLDLASAFPLPKPTGEAYLTEAVAPWPCSTYLRIRVGDAEVSIPAEQAAPVLSALHMLIAAGQEVTPR
jgi:hypothetical protein